jgi:hypothetical protein
MDGLPIVQTNEFLKRVNLPYPGRDKLYNWYLKLKSHSQQYGIYLHDMEQFEVGQSLCPTELYGVLINPSRYHEMKTPIYHFLSQSTTISADDYDVCNIVNKYAWNTDGYQALYDIMAKIHPALNPDAKFEIPHIKDYASVHEYYLHVDAYYMHENFSGRRYTPRQQLNTFLDGRL